jgi:thiamine pyrophosphokinase
LDSDLDLTTFPFQTESRILVGVDRGALKAIRSSIHLDYAIGDFDSVSKEELELIKAGSSNIEALNPSKDDTDTYHAYKIFQNISDRIVILGGIKGRRIEHFLAILNIVKEDSKVEIRDASSFIKRIDATSTPMLLRKTDYRYYSFFAIEPTRITLNGFRFPLNDYFLSPSDSLCISNEIEGDEGTVTLVGGPALIVLSRYDHS